MATSNSYFARQKYRFLSTDLNHHAQLSHDSPFELDESDIYHHTTTLSISPEYFRKPVLSPRLVPTDSREKTGGKPSSLPVNIPDWSRILKNEYRRGSDVVDDRGVRVPPHELLVRQMARSRIASFSVHEGIGRTLKGRDLSRVRNAIWEKTGFQD
ncbi:hypothetical protein NC653_012132 [Populus alba x Populus x berolinensis]|uniref:Senescence regulator n=1 Tax=Populus alba x Populus x berolinensis TaxID=444605 RepID=A0AAD6R4C9_9ROSI|nr:hypothetical protein NC653_012132 [Populus alba x Populus x berolinensis]